MTFIQSCLINRGCECYEVCKISLRKSGFHIYVSPKQSHDGKVLLSSSLLELPFNSHSRGCIDSDSNFRNSRYRTLVILVIKYDANADAFSHPARMITYHNNSILTAIHCARSNHIQSLSITNKLSCLRTRLICTQRTFAAQTATRGSGRINKIVTPAHSPTTVFLLPQNTRRTMATAAREVRGQSDISQMNTEQDGSFKRKPSSFRNTIEKGGKFEPEVGMSREVHRNEVS